jgi:hypothetical protein
MIKYAYVIRSSEADYDDYEQYYVEYVYEDGHKERYNEHLIGYQEAQEIVNRLKPKR